MIWRLCTMLWKAQKLCISTRIYDLSRNDTTLGFLGRFQGQLDSPLFLFSLQSREWGGGRFCIRCYFSFRLDSMHATQYFQHRVKKPPVLTRASRLYDRNSLPSALPCCYTALELILQDKPHKRQEFQQRSYVLDASDNGGGGLDIR